MSRLVPVKRLDKNGRLVTRHVLPASDKKSKVFAPAPIVQHAEASLSRGAVAARERLATLVGRMPTNLCKIYPLNVEEMEPSTLEAIGRYMDRGHPIMTDDIIKVISHNNQKSIREYYEFCDSVYGLEDYAAIAQCISNARLHYPKDGYQDFSAVPDSKKEIVRTVVYFLSVVENWEENRDRLHPLTECVRNEKNEILGFTVSRNLMRQISDDPERVTLAADFVKDRGECTADDVIAYLGSGLHSSMQNGFL